MIKNNLNVATWNANGLLQHIPEFQVFLCNEDIDVCLISETHFKQGTKIKIPGYLCFHSPHPADSARGGSAVIVKSTLDHYELPKIAKQTMQVATINIETKGKEFKIAAIYCPPKHSPTEEDLIDLFQMLGNNFIIGGDFNAKHTYWGSRLITTKGRKLYKSGRNFNCEFISTGSPTNWPSDPAKIPDVIDFFITKGINRKEVKVKSSDDLSSDHTPIILTVNGLSIEQIKNPRLTNKRTNWCKFRELIEGFINLRSPLVTTKHIDIETEQFIADVQQAAEDSTPTNQQKKQASVKYPAEIKQLILEKRRARRKWQATRYPGDKTIFNRLNNRLKKTITEFKNDSLTKYLCNLTADKVTDYSLWKAAKRLKRPQAQDPPLKTSDGKWIGDPKEKVKLFCQHLSNVFKPFPPRVANEDLDFYNRVDEKEIPYVSLREIETCIHNLNNRKSPGYDLITAQILKELPPTALLKLKLIINACFKQRYVPHHWKIAEIIVIPKQGKPLSEVTSYRPISLLPLFSKLFEKLLLKRLDPIIEQRKLIPTHQFGFRNKHSTIDQVHRITNVIEKALEEKQICSAIFLDVAQAFDKVWHKGLEFKLHRDLPRQYYEILKSYIGNRFFRVRYGSVYSELKEIQAGVPQGSVLGPTLYLLYTSDIPHASDTMIATFADDTALLSTDGCVAKATEKLQNSINEICDWTQRWRIKLNESKSIHINFTNKKITNLPVVINNQVVPYSNTAKYLGMNLDAKLKWKEHVKKKVEDLNIRYRKLYWLLGYNSELSIENKILLYNQILKPVWTYGIQLWGCTKKTNVQMLQTFQNKVLRGIVNAPWYIRNSDLHRDLQIDLVEDTIKKYAMRHNERLQMHINPEIDDVLNVRNNIRRLRRTKPHELF